MKPFRISFLLFSCAILIRNSAAGAVNGFSALMLCPDPRASALGEAAAALDTEVRSVFFNPSGLASIRSKHLYTQTYLPPFLEDTKYHNLIWAQPVSWGAWAVTTGLFHVSPFTRTVADSTAPDGYREVGDFTTYDLKISLSGAKLLKRNLAVGATLNFMRESLSDIAVHGFSMDVGMQYSPQGGPFRLGLSLQQLGPDVSFLNSTSHLPVTFSGGWSITQPRISPLLYIPTGTLLSFELQKFLYGGEFLKSGVEIPMVSPLKIRSGYKVALKKEHLASQWVFPNGFSIGVGIEIGDWSCDYSASSLGDLGLIHQISIDLRWKKN